METLVKLIGPVNDTETLMKIYKLFTILYGHVTVFAKSELDSKILHQSLAAVATSVWPALCESIKRFAGNVQFSEMCTGLVKSLLSTCSESLVSFNFQRRKNCN